MTPSEICNSVRTLQAQGRSVREISRLLKLSRNTVRRILRTPTPAAEEERQCLGVTLAYLKSAFERAQGFVVNVPLLEDCEDRLHAESGAGELTDWRCRRRTRA